MESGALQGKAKPNGPGRVHKRFTSRGSHTNEMKQDWTGEWDSESDSVVEVEDEEDGGVRIKGASSGGDEHISGLIPTSKSRRKAELGGPAGATPVAVLSGPGRPIRGDEGDEPS